MSIALRPAMVMLKGASSSDKLYGLRLGRWPPA